MKLFSRKKELKEGELLTTGEIRNIIENSNGLAVNTNTALTYSAVFSAVRKISQTIASMPLHLYRKTEDGREIAENHPISILLSNPNPEMDTNTFYELLQGWLELFGNAYAEIIHNTKTGYPIQLNPIYPENIQIQRNKNGEIEYKHIPSNKIIPKWKMFHIKGFTIDGIQGLSVIQQAKTNIGLGLSQSNFQKRYFSQGTQLGGFIELQNSLSPEAFERFKEQIKEKYQGLKNSHGIIILEDGAKYNPLKVNFEDAQFLESRKFEIEEIARWFDLPPHLLGHLDKATYSNIEQQGIESVIYCFLPRVVRWEKAIQKQLIPPFENELYVKFNLTGLQRADIKSRFDAYHIGIQDGWLNADEIRALEDLNPQPEEQGKMYLVPLNMVNKKTFVNPVKHTEKIKEEKELLKEKRTLSEKAIISMRVKTTEGYKPLLEEKAKMLVGEEIKTIKELIKKFPPAEDKALFLQNLETEYNRIKENIKLSFLPVYNSLSKDLLSILQQEVNRKDDINIELEKFIEKYVSSLSVRYVEPQKGQIKKIVNSKDINNIEEEINNRLHSWEETTASKTVNNEITRSQNAIAKSVYTLYGITKIRSVASGNSCPYCSSLDGKVIGIEQHFLTKGEYAPEGAEKPLTITSNISHPPYHRGCSCSIVAEI